MADTRLEEIRQGRLAKREQLVASGQVPYPSEVRRTHTLGDINTHFDALLDESTPVVLVGRVHAVRSHGSVVFIDLKDATGVLQLQVTKGAGASDLFERLDTVDVGDFIQATGELTRTTRGTNTLGVTELHVVSKSIRPLPTSWYGLKDHEARFRQREVDLLLNDSVKDVFVMRSRLIAWLRQYLVGQGYLEVTTPFLQPLAGGAAARPFQTHHNALDIPLYLRIALELYLKRLVVGGFEKVFEIGTCFRNEGVDRQHNPEFTMLELQWTYADYEDLMTFTEDLFEALVRELTGSTDVTWQGTVLSFDKPFSRQRYIGLVSERVGFDILTTKDAQPYVDVFTREHLEVPEPRTYSRLVDELYKELIRPGLVQPTLLYDYPAELVPLAKHAAHDKRIAEKFQFVVGGMELVNSYTELNDPVEQRRIFEEQQHAHEAGDREAHQIDEAYLRAMEYGMPPNAGWGLGVDRLVMLLADTSSIRDTLLFPLLRPE